jgi:hypothetical protein
VQRRGFLGATDWNRRLFDSLIPLPDGTSYNAYLVRGSDKTALLDTVDPGPGTSCSPARRRRARGLRRLPPRRTGPLRLHPAVLARYPEAKVVTNPKCKDMLIDLLGSSRRTLHHRRRRRDARPRRQDPRIPLHPLGPLARNHVHLAQRRPDPVLLRLLRLAPGHHRPLRDRPRRDPRGRQALLRRNHDALPPAHPPQPREGARQGHPHDRPQPRPRLRPSPDSSWTPTRTGPPTPSRTRSSCPMSPCTAAPRRWRKPCSTPSWQEESRSTSSTSPSPISASWPSRWSMPPPSCSAPPPSMSGPTPSRTTPPTSPTPSAPRCGLPPSSVPTDGAPRWSNRWPASSPTSRSKSSRP